MSNFRIIGITGRSGSGKSSVRRYYERRGYAACDADSVAHEVCAPGTPCLAELCAAFGGDILNNDSSLNRKKLAEKAFSSPKKNEMLISITHPHILREVLRQAEDARQDGQGLFFVDGAMIVGGIFAAHCDKIIVVTSDPKLSVTRIILRDGISKISAARRLSNQPDEATLCRAADFVIANNGSQQALEEHAAAVLAELNIEEKIGKHPIKPEKRREPIMPKEKTAGKKLSETLFETRRHTADAAPATVKKAYDFCEGYKAFLNDSKTERECADTSVAILKKAGYKVYEQGKKYKAGDKIYTVNRGRAVMAATIGKKPLNAGMRFSIAHMDAPRLDLKPTPLYEAEELSFFKTHYYGGIRKYQWASMPLAMHGFVVKADGKAVDIVIGEEPGEAVFTITDLLPHLSKEQDKRSLKDGLKGEELNILTGSQPYADKDEKDRVKLETMRLLNEKYGMVEGDFKCADIEFVPAAKALDVGFDKSMVGAYGQDDRVCCYTALMAEVEKKAPAYTSVVVLCDKEEIGSDGNTGLASEYFFYFLEDLCAAHGAHFHKMLEASACLSADVNVAYDPTFPDVFEKQNTSFLNKGVSLNKYGGSGGKYSASEASAEFMHMVTKIFNDAGVAWQAGELGKVDAGGGGTIAKFVAKHNVDVVDVGVPVLGMHSPFEVTSKLDVYHTYLAFRAFCEAD